MNKDINYYQDQLHTMLSSCSLCPRNCKVDRTSGEKGFCGFDDRIFAARAALHFWEEPYISGSSGSGAVFFSGCNMKCIFCQNREIAIGKLGSEITVEKLCDIFLKLQEQNANNINLVTGTHYIPQIALALFMAKEKGLTIPVVYNTSSYESPEALKLLEGLVDIYLPDLKYYSPEISKAYSSAPDYFDVAIKAIAEMYRQVGEPEFSEKDGQLLMKKGMIVRHLILPGNTKDSKKILRYLHETYGDKIFISIMNQYTPLSQVSDHPVLGRKVTKEEYDKVVMFAEKIGIEKGFIQEGEAADESFIPPFDFQGILNE